MDNKAHSKQEPQHEVRTEDKEQAQSARIAAPLPAQSVEYLMAGIPLSELPEAAVIDLASKLGNGVLSELLSGRGGIETLQFDISNDQSTPENPIFAQPPELTDPAGLAAQAQAARPYAPCSIAGRTAPQQAFNIFNVAGGAI